MGFFKKKSPEDVEQSTKRTENKKKKSDKSFKPKAPKTLAGRTILRYAFWTLTLLIFARGCASFVQGEKVVQQINNYGTEQTIIPESIKGFAVDFATEYFTWDERGLNDRGTRLDKFIDGIDQDAGLKPYDIKGNSRVLSAEVYKADQIDEQHIDVTVLIRREVQVPKIGEPSKKENKLDFDYIMDKSYVVVPVTRNSTGYVIKQYPRFIAGDEKSTTLEVVGRGPLVDDESLIQKSNELAENFLKTWYEANVTQLKYFYLDTETSPNNVPKTNYILDSVQSVALYHPLDYQNGASPGGTYVLEATVVVRNEIEEKFTNTWILNVIDQGGRLYVKSIGPNYKSADTSELDTETDSDQSPKAEPKLPESDFNVPLQSENSVDSSEPVNEKSDPSKAAPSDDQLNKENSIDPTIDPNGSANDE